MQVTVGLLQMDRAVFIHNTLRDFVSHLSFGIAHDYIVIRHQERIGDFSLGREGFTGTGGTQNQPVGVFELFPTT